MIRLLALLLAFLSACSAAPVHYFPYGTFDDDEEWDLFTQDWYSSHIESMSEPILYTYVGKPVYRFTWLRTFHPAMAFRINAKPDGSYALVSKRTNGAGGYQPGRLIDNEEQRLPTGKGGELIRMLEVDCDFWSLPTREQAIVEGDEIVAGTDGAQWIFEAMVSGRYHVVDRWSPNNGCLHAVGVEIMNLSKLEIDEVY